MTGDGEAAALGVVDPDPGWPAAFEAVARGLREHGTAAILAVDHVGSTAVPGLPAKDVVDVQVTVASPADLDPVAQALAAHGWRLAAGVRRDHPVPGLPDDDAQWDKRFLHEPEGRRRTNVHVRVRGHANQRYALLFRDYLRAHPAEARAYGIFKRRLARLPGIDVAAYTELKDPVCDLVYLPAVRWAAEGERPPPRGT